MKRVNKNRWAHKTSENNQTAVCEVSPIDGKWTVYSRKDLWKVEEQRNGGQWNW